MGRLEKKINGLRYIKILNNNLDFQGQFQNKLLFQHDNNPIHNSVLPETGWDKMGFLLSLGPLKVQT